MSEQERAVLAELCKLSLQLVQEVANLNPGVAFMSTDLDVLVRYVEEEEGNG